ncbi:MAG: DinB family protein [Pyrinomonadaceae bacterium]
MNQKEFEEHLMSLEQAPEILRGLINGLTDSAMRVKFSEDEFSALENICHLRDIEVEGYALRIRRILREDQPALPDLDGARLAFERDYNGQDVEDALRSFAEARARNVAVLTDLDAAQLERAGDLEGVGTVTLRELLVMLHDHDEGHIEEVRRLKNRLYAHTDKY